MSFLYTFDIVYINKNAAPFGTALLFMFLSVDLDQV